MNIKCPICGGLNIFSNNPYQRESFKSNRKKGYIRASIKRLKYKYACTDCFSGFNEEDIKCQKK